MCFSVQVDQDIKKLAKRFQASISSASYMDFKSLMATEKKLGIEGMEKTLELKHSSRRKSPIIKVPGDDNRVYSNYFSNVIVSENGKRVFQPMRYRVRPKGKGEIPAKYNVFNARIDSLETRQTWKPLFMRNHGIFPFVKFFEWVEGPGGKSKLITFSPDNYEVMWTPCLWDEWTSKNGEIIFKSFAIITDDPPPEILQKGHDRCPIFLQEEFIDDWLNPIGKSNQQIYDTLQLTEDVKYRSIWAA